MLFKLKTSNYDFTVKLVGKVQQKTPEKMKGIYSRKTLRDVNLTYHKRKKTSPIQMRLQQAEHALKMSAFVSITTISCHFK